VSLVDELIAERREAQSVSSVVLDTSALLAIVNEERGAEVFTGRQEPLNIFVMSTVNVSEAYGKLIGRGLAPRRRGRL